MGSRGKKKKRRGIRAGERTGEGVGEVVPAGEVEGLDGEAVGDLEGLSRRLSRYSPVGAQARALMQAFRLVVREAAGVEAVRLLEVPNDSPLVAWKHLIRALQAFYSGNDELCRRCLALISADSPVARCGRALTGLLTGVRPAGAKAGAVVDAVRGRGEELEQLLARLEEALEAKEEEHSAELVAQLHKLVVRACPGRKAWLTRALMLRAAHGSRRPDFFGVCWPEDAPSDHWFWAEMALARRKGFNLAESVLDWRRFVRLVGRSLEPEREALAAVGMMRAMSGAGRLSNDHVREAVDLYGSHGATERKLRSRLGPDGLLGLPPHELAGRLESLLSPQVCCDELLGAHPRPEGYLLFALGAAKLRRDWRDVEPVFEKWAKQFPQDPSPWLLLAEQALNRDVLTKAAKRLEVAAGLGADGPAVASLEARLWFQSGLAKSQRASAGLEHAVEEHARKLDGLGHGLEQWGRAAAAALRWCLAMRLGKAKAETAAHMAELAAALGTRLAARIVLFNLLEMMKEPNPAVTGSILGTPTLPGEQEAPQAFSQAHDWLEPFRPSPLLWDSLDGELAKGMKWDDRNWWTSERLADMCDAVAGYSFRLTLFEATRAGLRRGERPLCFLLWRATDLYTVKLRRRFDCLFAARAVAAQSGDDLGRRMVEKYATEGYELGPLDHLGRSPNWGVRSEELRRFLKDEELRTADQVLGWEYLPVDPWGSWDRFFWCECDECRRDDEVVPGGETGQGFLPFLSGGGRGEPFPFFGINRRKKKSWRLKKR